MQSSGQVTIYPNEFMSLDDSQPVSRHLIAFSTCICLSNNGLVQKAHFLFRPRINKLSERMVTVQVRSQTNLRCNP